jgi:hypothetical protein
LQKLLDLFFGERRIVRGTRAERIEISPSFWEILAWGEPPENWLHFTPSASMETTPIAEMGREVKAFRQILLYTSEPPH